MEPVIAQLQERFSKYVYGVDVDNLQTAAVHQANRFLFGPTVRACDAGR